MPGFSWLHGSRQPAMPLQPWSSADLLRGLLASGVYLAFFLLLQPLVFEKGGLGWDGADYFRLAQGDYQTPVYPLVQRIGMPLLVAQGPTADLLLNFRLWNGLFALLHGVVTWLLIVRLDPFRRVGLQAAAWVLVCANQLAPIPGATWMPVQNDIAAALLSQCLLLAVLAGQCHGWWLALLFLAGTLCRENFAQYALFFLFRWDLSWDAARSLPGNVLLLLRRNAGEATRLLLPSAIGYAIATAIVNHFVSKGMSVADRYKFYIDGVQWHHFSDVLLGWIGALSPVLFLFLLHRVRGLPPVKPVLPVAPVAIILGIFLVISLGAGLNTERYLYWMVPFLAVQAIPVIESLLAHQCRAILRFCALYALFMQRALLPVESSGLGGCGPLDILFGNSAFLGHFAQQCAENPVPLLEFFFGLVLPLGLIIAVWSPRPALRPTP